MNDDLHVDQIWLDVAIGWRLDQRLDETFRDIIALHERCPFHEVGWNERQELGRLGITRLRRPDRILEEFICRQLTVADELDLAEVDQRPLRDIEPKAAPGDDRVTDVNLGVAVFLVKKPEEKGGVICSRIRQTVLRDEGRAQTLAFDARQAMADGRDFSVSITQPEGLKVVNGKVLSVEMVEGVKPAQWEIVIRASS